MLAVGDFEAALKKFELLKARLPEDHAATKKARDGAAAIKACRTQAAVGHWEACERAAAAILRDLSPSCVAAARLQVRAIAGRVHWWKCVCCAERHFEHAATGDPAMDFETARAYAHHLGHKCHFAKVFPGPSHGDATAQLNAGRNECCYYMPR